MFKRIAEQTGAALNGIGVFHVQRRDLDGIWEGWRKM